LKFSIENQQCSGRFAGDLDLCCRDPTAYPVNIPVFIRGHPASSLQSGVSTTPSFAGGIGEEQMSAVLKRPSRGRIPSISHNGILTGLDNDNKSVLISGQEPFKSYKTFHLVRDSECFRPKLLADSTGNENEPIDQINTLYMRGIESLIFFYYIIRLFFLSLAT
jgi:hypothetical protein